MTSAAGCSGATPTSRLSGRSPAVPCTPPGCCTGRAGGRRTAVAGDRRPRSEPTTLPGRWRPRMWSRRVGMGLARGFVWSRGALESYFGPGRPSERSPGWSTPACGLGRRRPPTAPASPTSGGPTRRSSPGYATPPTSPLVSGSPESLLPFADLGQQGRRFVTDVVTPELIEQVMGEPARAHPIRAYVGFNSEPLYQTGRAELALAELERAGAFDRSVLLLISPTGTGWVDHTLIEAAEFLTRGDIATCCIQYATVSVVSVGPEGRAGPRPVPAAAVGGHPAAGRPAARAAPAGAGVRREHGRLDQLGRHHVPGHRGVRPLRDRPGPVGGAALAGQVVPQRHDPRQQHAGAGGDRRGLRPPRAAGGARRRPAGPAAGGRRLPRQRSHRRARSRPAGAAAPWLADGQRGRGVPQHHALAATGHLPPDGDGRDERDAADAGRVRLLRPRLPRRHGGVRA